MLRSLDNRYSPPSRLVGLINQNLLMVEWAKTYVSLNPDIRATNRQIVPLQILCLLFTLVYPLPGYSPYTLAWSFLGPLDLCILLLVCTRHHKVHLLILRPTFCTWKHHFIYGSRTYPSSTIVSCRGKRSLSLCKTE
jgi:hypothetical protein